MLGQTLWDKVQLAINLVLVARIQAEISPSVGKMSLLMMITALIIISSQASSYLHESTWNGKLMFDGILAIVRSVLSLLFVQILMQQVSATDIDMDFIDYANRDNMNVFSLFSVVSLKMSAVVEAVCMPMLIILALSFVIRSIPLQYVNAEVNRLVYGVQFIFAGTIGGIVNNSGLQKLVALTGLLNISLVTHHSIDTGEYTAIKIYTRGIYMAWVDIIVNAVVPAGEWSSSKEIDVIVALSLSMILQTLTVVIPGLENLQGYIEWRVATVVLQTLATSAIKRVELILLCSILLATFTFARSYMPKMQKGVSIMDTLVDIFTIAWVSVVSSYVLDKLVGIAGNDIIMVGLIATTAFGIIYTFVFNHVVLKPLNLATE
jgi:hypothetical protein